MIKTIRDYFYFVKRIEQAKRDGRVDQLQRELQEQQTAEWAEQRSKQEAFHARVDLQKTMARPLRYDAVDGSPEIGVGALLLCFALSSYANVLLSPWPWRAHLSYFLVFFGCLAIPLSRWLIKKYVSWPRTGYVAYGSDRTLWIVAVIAIVLGAAWLLLLHPAEPGMKNGSDTMKPEAIHPGIPGATGTAVLFAMVYLVAAIPSIMRHRWKWLVLVLLLGGSLGISHYFTGSFMERWRPLILFASLMSLISGVATLISYVRHSSPPASELA